MTPDWSATALTAGRRIAAGMVALVGAAMGSPVAEAQPAAGSLPRIGYVTPPPPASEAARIEDFRQGLRELGHVEGRTIVVEYRHAAAGLGHRACPIS